MPANPPATAPQECVRTTSQKRPFAHIEDRSFPCLWAHCRHTSTTPFALDASAPPPLSTQAPTNPHPQLHLHQTHLAQQVRRVQGLNRLLADGQPGLRHVRCRFYGCHETFPAADALSCHLSTHTGKRHFQCGACGRRFVSYFGMEGWGHEAWHEVLRVRPLEGHARHMKALMERMGREGVLVDAAEERVVEEEEEEGFTTETEEEWEEEEGEEEEGAEGEEVLEGGEVLEGEKPSDDPKTAQEEQDN